MEIPRALQSELRDAVNEIKVAVLARSRRTRRPDPSLHLGAGGDVLFLAYSGEGAAAKDLANRAIESLSSSVLPPTLFTGFVGLGWVAAHLARERIWTLAEDALDSIDDAVAARVYASAAGDFDLMFGNAGLALYALERKRSAKMRRLLMEIVEFLDRHGEISPAGITWRHPPSDLPPSLRGTAPGGLCTLGVAHGQAGVMGTLAAIGQAGVARKTTRRLLEGALRWLDAQRLPALKRALFPKSVGRRVMEPARTSWCTGDAGIAAMMLTAARALRSRRWETEAVQVARVAAARTPRDGRVFDACLCHGSAGLAHVYGRMAGLTGNVELSHARSHWLSIALGMRRRTRATAGFRPSSRDIGSRSPTHHGLLYGIAGIGLCLLAATSGRPPAWDRVILPGLPPAPKASR